MANNNNNNDQLDSLLTENSTEGTEFRDLLQGDIDIIEYLGSSDTPIDSPLGPSDGVSRGHTVQHLRVAAMMLNGNGVGGLQQQPTTSASGVSQQQQQQNPQQLDAQRRRVTAPGNYVHPPRLPESPPETDSGAGSAGSPSSSSEQSPYSPDFQGYANLLHHQSTVIHPPVGGPHQNGNGVILGVHDLNQAALMQDMLQPSPLHHHGHPHMTGPRAVVHHPSNGNAHALASPQQAADFASPYPSAQPTPGALPQVSPPTANSRGPPPSPYIMPQLPMDTYYIGPEDQAPGRKRMRSNSFVKPEPTSPTGEDYDMDGYPTQQCIRFSSFQEEVWHVLCDTHGRELRNMDVHVVADKGFNFSHFDGCFVNQKKNHFQVSVHIEAKDDLPPQYVRVDGQMKLISEFRLAFYGVKSEMPSSTIMIKQSQTDRKPVPHEPVQLAITERRVTKVTVPRLHFSETTMNNQRKNGRPNPDQKYIQLVVSLNAVTPDKETIVISTHASEKVIVRASNPGQFDNGESDVSWQKTSNGSSVFHPGPVCIGTDRPQATLTVAGDIACTGQVFHPSDRRIKDNISEINYEKALGRLDKLRVVEYSIRPEIAREWGISEEARHRVGIIAQELAEIMPDAVNEDGDYLTVDDNRIFYDTVAAAKELSRLTGNLECKIDEVEKISQKLARLARLKKLGSFKSTQSVISGAGLSQAGSEASSGICAGGGSYISCSRSSLGSASPPSYRKSDKGKDRPDVRYTSGHSTHRHQKHCRHACHRVDQGLCSNKIIQWTIAILVAVMAFCVLAMATLYTLDWYKRNYGTPTYVTPAPAITARPDAAKDGGPGNIIEVKPSASWRPPKQRGVPEISPCKEAQCQAYCCGDPLAYETDSGAKAADVDIVVALPGAKAEDNKYSNDQQSRSRRYNSESPIASNSVLLGPAQPFADVRIEIPEFNITLDQRYCQGGNCSKPKEGRFDLYIPISTYMPTIPLEIVFETGSKRYVDSCGRPEDFAWKHCVWKNNDPFKSSKEVDSSRLPGAKKKSVNVFEIPAGDFIKSAYTFRVGYTTESCTMNIDQKGKGFDEYRLFFYRSCSNDKAFD